MLGFVAYATYDLTNQATLSAWQTKLTLIDLMWGTVLTAASATGGYFRGALGRGAFRLIAGQAPPLLCYVLRV